MNCQLSLKDVSKPRHWYYHCSLRVKITRPWCWPSLTRSDFSRADWSKAVVDKSTMEMTWWCCTSLYWDHSPKARGSIWVLNIFRSFLWWIRVKTTEKSCRFLFSTPAKISEGEGALWFRFEIEPRIKELVKFRKCYKHSRVKQVFTMLHYKIYHPKSETVGIWIPCHGFRILFC